MRATLTGAVLAGGPGRRLGGGKPWRRVAGRRLIDIALDRAQELCPQTLVVAADAAEFAELECAVLADRWPGQGPLAALATIFLDTPATSVLLLPVDAPMMRPALLKRVLELSQGQKAVAPQGPGGVEALMSWYGRDCLEPARLMLRQGERRLRLLLNRVGARIMTRQEVAAVDPDDLSFVNVNFPEDLERAEREILQRGLFDTP
ncbi:MAG: NTP transferase domain-containing protein [Desulfarculaceae bacterium]|nr:NTP transferase domain-containing protein [Desulfarculaceae bacterium]MCF8073753.1 NTP transferase domain-containing protein [Desulfarculaceae bacterium]MCF8101994.1 NTP transferase domain-containing protein [Desulfarculaceae bacterium]MCF8115964.1 NTP transferase domain-containing protein [Desulfarculaceae bacterium]